MSTSLASEAWEAAPALALSDGFAHDVLQGLSRSPKVLPCKYFYDGAGSRLFQQISELDEYYLTRCEREILQTHGRQIAQSVAGAPLRLVELGVGDGQKTEVLLQQFLHDGLDFQYVPIDICRQAIVELTERLGGRPDYAPMRVRGIAAEYFDGLALARQHNGGARSLVLFLGSSIGNLAPHEARRFLRRLRSALSSSDYTLIGFDLKKDLDVLQRAYNDAQGLTRQFNFNLLERINRELGGRFDCRRFRHYGNYNTRQGCMESWLLSRERQHVPVRALQRVFSFAAWEGIHVENSFKYDLSQIESLATAGGFQVCRNFFDSRRWFVDSLWQAV